jgi:voltage-gated potassium channel
MNPNHPQQPGKRFSGKNDRVRRIIRTPTAPQRRTPVEAAFSFWRRDSARRIVLGFCAIQIVVMYGVIGYMALGWTLSDSLYQVVITISGVGFTEVHPLLTNIARLHTVALIGAGLLSVAFTLGAFVQFLAEGEIQKYFGQHRMQQQLESLSGHTVVVGFGRVGALVCEELTAVGHPFVVIDSAPERIAQLQARGYLSVLGDATEDKVLMDAGIDRAVALVTVIPDDAKNLFITLTVRQMGCELTIIGRAEQPGTPKKLRQAGADHVVMPAGIGAHRIVSLITNPKAVEFAELVTKRSSLHIEMDEILIAKGDTLIGRTLRDADVGHRTGVIVVAIKRADGSVEFPPDADQLLSLGDSIVILGRRDNLESFQKAFSIH